MGRGMDDIGLYKYNQQKCTNHHTNQRTPMTSVGLRGSVRIETERVSGIVLIPPSLTFILHKEGVSDDCDQRLATYFRQTFAKY